MAAARKVQPVAATDLDLGGTPPRAATRLRSNIVEPPAAVAEASPAPRRRRAAASAGAIPVTTVTTAKYVKIQIEENDTIPSSGMFVSLNGRGYLVKPGCPVDVPPGVIEILNNAVEKMAVKDPQTQQVIGYRDKLRYPYRVL